jgi:ferrochelatase
MLQVAHHYEMFGGVSPINNQNLKLINALQIELDANGPKLPIYWGNRNWHPLLPDTLQQMTDDGIKHALAFVTSAYSSYSSCRQYRQNIIDAQALVGSGAPSVEKLRAFYNHPLFIEANVDRVRDASARLGSSVAPQIVFTAHSVPESMAENCDYVRQLKETSRLIADAVGIQDWQLVYQSRSGSPTQPWLGPDICDHLRSLKSRGVFDVVVAPIGFVSDHMEVIYDLDVEAQRVAEEIGLNIVRASTVGTHPSFVQMIRELILERTEDKEARYLGSLGAAVNTCPPNCCAIR